MCQRSMGSKGERDDGQVGVVYANRSHEGSPDFFYVVMVEDKSL